jgi:hypothetical protein
MSNGDYAMCAHCGVRPACVRRSARQNGAGVCGVSVVGSGAVAGFAARALRTGFTFGSFATYKRIASRMTHDALRSSVLACALTRSRSSRLIRMTVLVSCFFTVETSTDIVSARPSNVNRMS